MVNSYDPNYKEVSPSSLSPNGGWLTYTIHFQNTGSDTAYNIFVRDTLSSYVLPETFRYIASSHYADIKLTGRAIDFTFPHIDLVDSATNPALSSGWVQYMVKTSPSLPLQAQVRNTAYIYFDANAAIMTNTAISSVIVASVSDIVHADISIYPNPNTGAFTLHTASLQNGTFTISDMSGQVVLQKPITTDRQVVDMGDFAAGIYIVSVHGIQGSKAIKVALVK